MHSRRIPQQRKRGRERQRASNERGRDDDDDEESEKSACVVSKSKGICRNRFPSLARQRAAPLRKMRVERRERDVSSLQRGRAKMKTTNLVSARGRAAAASDMPWLASSGCTVVVKSPAAPSAPAAAAGAPRPPLDETNSERRCCSRRFMSFFWIENESPTSSRARKRFSKRVESRERSVCLPFFSTVGSHFFFLLFFVQTNDSKPKRLLRWRRRRGVHPRPLPRPADTAVGTGTRACSNQSAAKQGQKGPALGVSLTAAKKGKAACG